MASGHDRIGAVRQRARRTLVRSIAPLGILSYHRIAEPEFDPWNLSVSATNFADHLATLADHGRFVPLREAVGLRRLRLGKAPRYAVTFDDGYADNLSAALPVLERFDVPATVFVSTGFLDRSSFWWDVLDEAVLDAQRPLSGLVEAGRGVGLLVRCGVDSTRADIQAELHESLASRPPLDVGPLIDELLTAASAPSVADGRPLTTDELVTLAAHPLVTIGVHTVHHVRLTKAARALAERELIDSAAHLDRLLGAEPRALAYPHGDSDGEVSGLAGRTGFTCAVTTDHRWASPGDDRMSLPRLTVTDLTGAEVRRRLAAARGA